MWESWTERIERICFSSRLKSVPLTMVCQRQQYLANPGGMLYFHLYIYTPGRISCCISGCVHEGILLAFFCLSTAWLIWLIYHGQRTAMFWGKWNATKIFLYCLNAGYISLVNIECEVIIVWSDIFHLFCKHDSILYSKPAQDIIEISCQCLSLAETLLDLLSRPNRRSLLRLHWP